MRKGATHVTVIHGREIDAGLAACWQGIVDSNPEYSSPYLTPIYTQIAAQYREQTRVAVLSHDGQIGGFFPFELNGHRTAGPVGNHFSDYQAVIHTPSIPWSVRDLLEGAGLDEWTFDHLLASQTQFLPCVRNLESSAIIDLTMGYSHYKDEAKTAGRRQIAQSEKNERRMKKHLSALNFTWHQNNEDDLNTLLSWKRDQRARTGYPGHYSARWENDLIHHLATADGPAFGGVLSTLHADGRLIAADLGLRSRSVLHGWIPAYSPDLAQYSPGHVLFLSMLRATDGMGISRIDLGKGLFHYKRRLMTGCIPVCEGVARQ
jgi:CelD/BcsL family acetyltransferase involved in cellulose biosynthesis